ncbi:hypothetical protein H0H93_016101, partial [Arthromyces matolae]
MSARTPFTPMSRPPSRLPPQQDAPEPAKTIFTLDTSNPLNGSVFSKAQIDLTGENEVEKCVPDGPRLGPLNTGSLLKGRNASQVDQSRKPRPFQSSSRPGTADTHDQEPNRSNSLNIISPVPRQVARPASPSLSNSLASGVFSLNMSRSAFRMPSLPSSTSIDAPKNNDLHVPNSTIGFS